MSYLKHKPGSIEEIVAKETTKLNDNAYQDMFKKELEKAGKGIGAMTPAEKKAFFNKIDDKYKAKNEAVDNPYAVGMAAAMKAKDDKPPLKKSTITKAHDIAKSIKKDEKNEDLKESTDINFMKGDGAEVSYLKRHGSFMGGGKYYKFRGVNINFFVYYNEKNKNYVEQLKLTSGNRPSNDREYDKMYDVLKKLGNERRLGKLDDSDVDIYFEGVNEEAKYPHKMYSKDGKEVEAKTPEDHKKYADMGYTHKNETHTFMTKDMNKSKKDAKGEKEIVDPAPKIVQEAIDSQVYSLVRKYQNKEKPIEFTKDLSKVLDNMKREVNNLNSFKKEMQIKITADREMVIDEIRRMIEIQRMKFDNPAGKPIYNIMLKMTTDVNGISQELDEKEPNSNLIKKYLNNVIGLHKRLQISLRNVKETVDSKPKMSFKEAYKKAKKEAMNTVGDATADQANQIVGDGPKENDPDIKKPKAKADTGSKATPIDTSPEVEYKN